MRAEIIVLVALFGYFLGGIMFAKLVGRFVLKEDVTKRGSGNPGTMNMYRNYGFKIGVVVLILDAAKGVIPAVVGMIFLGQNGIFIGGSAAVLGHCFPIMTGFKGGKGVATALGVFWVSSPVAMCVAFVAMLGFLALTEVAGVTSLVFISSMTIWEASKHSGNYVAVACILGIFVLIWFAHRSNILKTLTGNERKTSFRKLFIRKKKTQETSSQNK